MLLCRKIIRQCCDELNTLVPFCCANTDKATTLRWTTTYLKYINKTNRDTLKEVCLWFFKSKDLFGEFWLDHLVVDLFGAGREELNFIRQIKTGLDISNGNVLKVCNTTNT